jgi:glyoxylase-like metal-dependent hydrolase (beta-lactamase superfamily II)
MSHAQENYLFVDIPDDLDVAEEAPQHFVSPLLTRAIGLAALKDRETLPSGAVRIVDWHSSMFAIPIVEGGNEFVLLDAGMGKNANQLFDYFLMHKLAHWQRDQGPHYLDDEQTSPKVRAIVVSHAHPDHTRGIRGILKNNIVRGLDEIPVYVSEGDADILRGKRKSEGPVPHLLDSVRRGSWSAVPEANLQVIEAGKVLSFGEELTITSLGMPGHTRGSLGYLVSRKNAATDLFVFDAFDFRQDGRVTNAARPFTADPNRSRQSIPEIANFITRNNIEISAVVPTHSGTGSIDAVVAYNPDFDHRFRLTQATSAELPEAM